MVRTLFLCACPVHLKGPQFACSGLWIGGRGRLRRCHKEGRAPLLSECVMQQPLLWTPEEKTFGVDAWKCFLRFVLSVGGPLRSPGLVTFPLWNIWQVSVERHQCEHYIKVLCFFSLSAAELRCFWCPADCACWFGAIDQSFGRLHCVCVFFFMAKHINSLFCKASISQRSCISADTSWNPPLSSLTFLQSS